MMMMIEWKHRTAARSGWHQVLNRIFIGLVLSCVFHYAESRWCTKTESYKTVRPMVVQAKCNQTYQEDCGWFTSSQCTRYEMVECMKEQNQTITRYKITTSCCPGFKLDPINNITCIVDENHPQEALRNGGGGTGKAGLKKLVSGEKAEPLTEVKGGAEVATRDRVGDGGVTDDLSKQTGSGAHDSNSHHLSSHSGNDNSLGASSQSENDNSLGASSHSGKGKADVFGKSSVDGDVSEVSSQSAIGGSLDVSSQSTNDDGDEDDDNDRKLDKPSLLRDKNLGVTVHSGLIPVSHQTSKQDNKVEAQRTKQEEDKGILASLSSGAYTGIICALVFVMCVLALIGVHFLKRQRRLKSKSDGEAIGMEATQKMLKA